MKINLFLIVLLVLISCSNPDKADSGKMGNLSEKDDSPAGLKRTRINQQAEPETETKKENWLTPEYLTADFNNDGLADTAIAIIIEGKKGFKIKHGGKDEEFLIGAGNTFGNGGDDFGWVDYWKLVNDSISHKQTFSENGDVLGAEDVKLESTAFYLGQEEAGGATIAWIGYEYVWIHQAD